MGAVREYELLSHFFIANKGYKTPCWLWRGPVNDKGYPITNKPGMNSRIRMHRFFYETYKGNIPSDLEIDHLCAIRHCVNPDHLEAVTHRVNIQRAIRRGRQRTLEARILSKSASMEQK